MRGVRVALAVIASVGSACGGGAPPILECADAPGMHPVCGFQNPEDLAVLPGGKALLVSQFGAMDGTRAGNLAVFRLEGEALTPLFPTGGTGGTPDVAAGERWADPECPPPTAAFSPHGIDLAPRPDGRLALYVVNHGGRESVELFEVTPTDDGATLAWRGCALPPDETFMNDVVALPDGNFLVTHMYPKRDGIAGFLAVVRGMLGMDTGYVLEWSPKDGFQKVPGTDAPFPNGIEASPDGRQLYLNVYLGGEVRKIDHETGELLASAEVRQPDNITWAADGSRLLVASHTAGMREMLACGEIHQGACGFEFQIVALEPDTLARQVLFTHAGAPMGAATVAVQVGGDLWLGSFAGDRVARVPIPN